MLLSEMVCVDHDQVPLEGRAGWRPLLVPLASGYRRSTVTEDGVELVVSQIQCGWLRMRRLYPA